MNEPDIQFLISYQRQYLDIVTEFFLSVTNKQPTEFARPDNFHNALNKLFQNFQSNPAHKGKVVESYNNLSDNLKKLYDNGSSKTYELTRTINRCKLNFGSGYFLEQHLRVARRVLLFSDTVIIPDPIWPLFINWRTEEKFRFEQILQMAFYILHLSDLVVQDDRECPSIVILPYSDDTIDPESSESKETLQLITEIFKSHIHPSINRIDDVYDYARNSPGAFLTKVEDKQLFLYEGGHREKQLGKIIKNYKKSLTEWFSRSYCETLFSLGDANLVAHGMVEQIIPNYKLLDYSSDFCSNPILCSASQAHYFRLVAETNNLNISESSSFDPSSMAIINSLASKRLDFLSNIDDSKINEFRKTNENISFRRELRDLINSLPATKLHDMEYVASEICSHIELAISRHEKQIEFINDKYISKHKYTSLLGFGTLAITLFPVLAPFFSTILPLGLASTAGKYVSDKFDERAEKRRVSNAMMGVIALEKNKN